MNPEKRVEGWTVSITRILGIPCGFLIGNELTVVQNCISLVNKIQKVQIHNRHIEIIVSLFIWLFAINSFIFWYHLLSFLLFKISRFTWNLMQYCCFFHFLFFGGTLPNNSLFNVVFLHLGILHLGILFTSCLIYVSSIKNWLADWHILFKFRLFLHAIQNHVPAII